MTDMQKALSIAIITESQDIYETIDIQNEKEAVEKLREVTEGCPMCMLAAIRQTGYPAPLFSSFDFKKEREDFWTEFGDSEPIDYGGY